MPGAMVHMTAVSFWGSRAIIVEKMSAPGRLLRAGENRRDNGKSWPGGKSGGIFRQTRRPGTGFAMNKGRYR
jgi:hypothetical protein